MFPEAVGERFHGVASRFLIGVNKPPRKLLQSEIIENAAMVLKGDYATQMSLT